MDGFSIEGHKRGRKEGNTVYKKMKKDGRTGRIIDKKKNV